MPDTDAKAEAAASGSASAALQVAEAVKRKALRQKPQGRGQVVPDDLAGADALLRLKRRFVMRCRWPTRRAVADRCDQGEDGARDGRGDRAAASPRTRRRTAAEAGRRSKAHRKRRRRPGLPETPHFELLRIPTELGLALGIENVIHAALDPRGQPANRSGCDEPASAGALHRRLTEERRDDMADSDDKHARRQGADKKTLTSRRPSQGARPEHVPRRPLRRWWSKRSATV